MSPLGCTLTALGVLCAGAVAVVLAAARAAGLADRRHELATAEWLIPPPRRRDGG